MTYTFNCTLIHILSAVSTDHITIRLESGVPVASYNLGYRTHQIAFRRPIQVNDGNYHKLRFNRFGQNSTLQLDSNWTVNLHPRSRSGARLFTVFNSHSHIRLGGVDNQQPLLNYDIGDYTGNYDERPDSSEDPDESLEKSALIDKANLRAKNNNHVSNYVSNQIVNSLDDRPTAQAPDHFVGIMMNLLVNGYSILDMAAEDNPNVIVSGDVHLLLSLPKSSAHHHRSVGHIDQLGSHETNYIKQQRDLNHFHLNHRKPPSPKHKDLLEMMQGDQPAYAERSRQANKLVRVNNDNEKRDKNSPNGPNNQNYEGDDLIFSGSGCFDDEDECANYADAGSGYDDLITPVYVPIKPTPNSKSKSSSNKNKQNKPNQRQRPKCTPPVQETGETANRVARTEDDEEDDDDDECEFEGSGAGEAEGSSNSEETTERTSNSVDNQNGELYPYQLSTTEQSNVINRVTIDDDDRSILFTSQPIPPPASELEKIIESTTRRPPPPKRPGGHIEIVMLPLPSETATPKSSLINRAMNKENRKMSGIQITGLSPNDITNLEDELDASFDDGGQGIGYGRDPGLSDTGNDILGGAIHINKNLIDFKFNKNSADRTALLIAAIAILIIIIVIIAPIIVFIKMRLRISRNGKLAGVPITTAQLSPAYQATSKSYASLAASGSMMVNPLGAPLGACNPAAFASNPNFHSNMHLGSIMPPNLTLTTNPVYGTIDSKAPKLPNKKDINNKEWYV